MRAVVVRAEGHRAEGVEVVGDTGHQLGGGYDGTVQPGCGRHGAGVGALRHGPATGEAQVEQRDEAHGVGAGRRPRVAQAVPGQLTVHGEAGDDDPSFGRDVHRGRAQREVVHPAPAGDLECHGRLADDGPGVLGAQGPLGGQLAEVAPADRLRDGVQDAGVLPDVQDAQQPQVRHEGGATGSVLGLGHPALVQHQRPHRTVEDLVACCPHRHTWEVARLTLLQPVTTGEERAAIDDRVQKITSVPGGCAAACVLRPTALRARPAHATAHAS